MKTLHSTTLPALVAALGLAAIGTLNAATYDLTSGVGATTTIDGAIFLVADPQSTGTGVIQPFLRLQGNGTEIGLNSDTSAPQNVLADTKTGAWTHDIQLSDLGTTTISGTPYYVFLLDINQTNNKPLLSLDTFDLYTRGSSISGPPLNDDSLAEVQAGGVLRYTMDTPDNNEVLLDYSLNPGSGSGDLWVYVPTSKFAVAASTDFVYLYTQFGGKGGNYEANDGFEEWATVQGPAVPEGGTTIALLGACMLLIEGLRRKVRRV